MHTYICLYIHNDEFVVFGEGTRCGWEIEEVEDIKPFRFFSHGYITYAVSHLISKIKSETLI
jgi:hypothetical protein